jgi:hypothetical protein
LLPAKQRTQGTEQTNVILQRALQNPHSRTRLEPQLRQFNQAATLPRPDLADDGIRNARRDGTIHYQAAPPRADAVVMPAGMRPQ